MSLSKEAIISIENEFQTLGFSDTKKFVIKGQVFVNQVPVGQQFVMSEHIIEKFDYEKLRQLKAEIILPALKAGAEVAAAIATKGASAKSGLVALAQKGFKSHKKVG